MSSSQTYTKIEFKLEWFCFPNSFQGSFSKIIFCWVVLAGILIPGKTFSQTTILSNPGLTYTNSDGPTGPDIYSVDVSNCTSISYSLNYSFSLSWEGSGNLETSDECAFGGPCPGDPNNPTSGTCDTCWDFLWGRFHLDGFQVGSDLIGDSGTTDAEQSGTMSLGPICTNGATNADITMVSQTWAASESVTFSNLMIVCWEGTPTISTLPATLCEGEDLPLNGTVTDNGVISSWLWTIVSGSGNILNATSPNATLVNGQNGTIISLTATDVNSCTATDSQIATFTPAGMATDPNINDVPTILLILI